MIADRITILRQRCLDRKTILQPTLYPESMMVNDAESLKKSEELVSWQLRIGLRTKNRLQNINFEIDEQELLIGRAKFATYDESSVRKAEEYLKQYPRPNGQTGHCELGFSLLMDVGITGIIHKLQNKVLSADTPEKKETYNSFICALDGLSEMIRNSAEVVDSAIAFIADEGRKAELKEISESCWHISEFAPSSFREALQLNWFAILGTTMADNAVLVSPGRLDRTLISFYQKDIENGVLDKAQALQLLECYYILINDLIPDGLAIAIMVGGTDKDGNGTTNKLSYLCMEALRKTKMVYPTVGVCWNKNTPEELTDLTVGLISKGYATPAFFGDETIQKGLKHYGTLPENSCYYINSTCVEITPSGGSNVWVASPYFSTCKILLDEIDAQAEKSINSFDTFMKAYFERLGQKIKIGVAGGNKARESRRLYGRKPLQSVFTKDCIERGRDIDDGGARYNWVECSFVGLANLADSLYVIKEEVFEKKTTSFDELKKMLDTNFEDSESRRIYFLEDYPKYGNGCKEVDSLLNQVRNYIEEQCEKYKMLPDDSHFIPGAFCWIMHERLGSECGATPDGRCAGFPFADGGGPAQGREKSGPTSGIISTTAWDHSSFIGGVAYNMKFNKNLFNSPESREKLKSLIITYLKMGGFETQVNVVDYETLKKAVKNPEEYRDLVVRIGGYTDYFTRLSTGMQKEVMLRTEFGLKEL